jgi:hypothetical protein
VRAVGGRARWEEVELNHLLGQPPSPSW